MGWCPAPPPYPKSWGASPDGLQSAPSEQIVKHMPKELWELAAASRHGKESTGGERTWGALEIKTSRTKLTMEPYFYPQVYMEMISLGVYWADLIRYKPGYGAYIYRIYRDAKIEQALFGLWKRAFANADRLQAIVQEPEFVKMRDYFTREANKIKPIDKIEEPKEVLAEYTAYKNKLIK
jgi:hypothetical protein